MVTKHFSLAVVFSILVMVCTPVFAAKLPLDRPQATRAINILPQKIQPGTPAHTTGVEDDEQFALTEGEGLDRYLYRSSSPIVFSIPVDRYYGITDGNGRLLHPETISGTIKLTLRVWDVDSDYTGPDAAPERDLVYINNYQCPGWLTGSSDVWSTFTCDVPVSEINFPNEKNTQELNRVTVHIDTANSGPDVWAVLVDWGRLEIVGARPSALIHGFFSGPGTWGAWTASRSGFLDQTGIPGEAIAGHSDVGDIFANAGIIGQQIEAMKRSYGVDRVNIVGHSKGGLDSRAYLLGAGKSVRDIIMVGTPNAGSNWANLAKIGSIVSRRVINPLSRLGEPALTQLTTWYMSWFNRNVRANSRTNYYTIAGNWPYGPWVSWILGGPNDGVVTVQSVESQGFGSLGRPPVSHTAQTSSGSVFGLSNPIIRSAQTALNSPLAHTGSPSGRVRPGQVALAQTVLLDWPMEAAGEASTVVLFSQGDLAVVLIRPDGVRIDPAYVGRNTDVEIISLDDVLSMRGKGYRVFNPMPGLWRAEITATAAPASGMVDFLVTGGSDSAIALSVHPRSESITTGSPINLDARLFNGAAPILGAHVEAVIASPDGLYATVVLRDDGLNGDIAAADGVYFARHLSTAASGIYEIAVTATGTSPSFLRSSFTGVDVTANEITLTGTNSDQGVDTNGDGLFEKLRINVGVNVARNGNYIVLARLQAANGRELEQISQQASLTSADTSIALLFDGSRIARERADGPYRLSELRVLALGGVTHEVLVRTDVYTTQTYSWRQFQRLPITFGAFTDAGADTNGNGQFEFLNVDFYVDVTTAGTYVVDARLTDLAGADITRATGFYSLAAGEHLLRLPFDGPRIGARGLNGPYVVKDLAIYLYTNSNIETSLSVAHQTGPYYYWQFEGQIPNLAPTANVGGPYSGRVGTAVIFNGAGSSDPEGQPLTYSWNFGDGGTGSGPTPNHTYASAGTYTVTLVVNDGTLNSTPATTTAVISPANLPPVANAGRDQVVEEEKRVILNGTASYDPDGRIVSYQWTQRSGKTVKLKDANKAIATFNAPEPKGKKAEILVFELRVIDNTGLSATDTVTITVKDD